MTAPRIRRNSPCRRSRRRPNPPPADPRRAVVAAAVAALAAACSPGPAAGAGESSDPAGAPEARATAPPVVEVVPAERPPVVEVVPAERPPAREPGAATSAGDRPFADPRAEPATALGEVRARYLPVWLPDLDWAFPPEVCGSPWELDAIAEPTAGADPILLGDPEQAAALAVMRYEYLLSRALARPQALAQICVAVATVPPARTDDLELLESYLRTGSRRAEAGGHPDEVLIVAAGPAVTLAVACVVPGYPTVVAADGTVREEPRAPARLHAYLLTVAAGREDAVTDVSYRVSRGTDRQAADCSGLDAWRAEWEGHVRDWLAAGELWVPSGREITTAELCEPAPPAVTADCPRDWRP